MQPTTRSWKVAEVGQREAVVKDLDFIKHCRKPLKELKLASEVLSSFAGEITLEAVSEQIVQKEVTKSVELENVISIRTVKQEESKINDQLPIGEWRNSLK